jgi:putative intracellular protease/amidase
MDRTASLFLVALATLTACTSDMPSATEMPTMESAADPTATPTMESVPDPTATPIEESSEMRACTVLFVLPEEPYNHHTAMLDVQFEDAGCTVVMASKTLEPVDSCGVRRGAIQPDLTLADVQVVNYDAIVYAGGHGCYDQWEDAESLRIAREAVEQGKVLGGIGCGPTILAHAGVLEGRQATVCLRGVPVKRGLDYCEVLESLGAVCTDAQVVRDGLIVTARDRSRLFVPAILEVLAEQ